MLLVLLHLRVLARSWLARATFGNPLLLLLVWFEILAQQVQGATRFFNEVSLPGLSVRTPCLCHSLGLATGLRLLLPARVEEHR